MFQGFFKVHPWLPRPGIHLTALLKLSKVKWDLKGINNVVYVYRNPEDNDVLYV